MSVFKDYTREQFAKENFPDMSHHNNVMTSHLTPEVSGRNSKEQQGEGK